MRLFVAVELPEELRESLAVFSAGVRGSLQGKSRVKWVERENLHLTLRFIGETDESSAASMRDALDRALAGLKRFSAEVKGAGVFPDLKRARILWAGVLSPERRLESLAAEVESALVSSGAAPADRPFSPHLTLARFDPPSANLAGIVQKYVSHSFGLLPIEKAAMIQSRLTSAGPVYSVLQEFPLAV